MQEDGCKIEATMEFLSKKWTLLLIKKLADAEKMRFNRLIKELNGISPKTLTIRLKELEKMRLLKRESFAEIPPRVEYSLTQKGIDLGMSLQSLAEWTSKWES